MKLALIGASGFVGSAVLTEALQRGHDVTAIVSHPEKITTTDSKLTVKKGNALDANSIAELVTGHDAVVSTFNAGWTNPNLYDDFLKGAEAIEQGTQQAGVKRYLFVGGAGSLEVALGVQLVDTPQFPAEWKPGALSARDYLTRLRQNTTLDWTFLSPAINLAPGERTGTFRIGTEQPVFDEKGESKITVADLAVAILNEIEQPQFVQKRFTVGY
ncbi:MULTISPECIES: NAD(P)-dependent oxidoreductase [unclassified Spirosoma]|uniref:NAD(P)-dependent oxidoreductase n=1 Tax=unclassified Spirosoma TaxID=2621999 RepID=UPI000959E0F1|nr:MULTISPECIES: NAD(P)-dependent oxidoreductase [unclassified Spirosoma]MBN8826491.1 NAD(P)-dependent oxidoreductase [Spirosoma sp.]OJW76418.1 MAG: 3-beta hydroxysteroid dehydrogenase [Spirosoma sp. 48-14]